MDNQGKTMTEKAISRAAGQSVGAGETVWVTPDLLVMHDSNALPLLETLADVGGTALAAPEHAIIVIDHRAPVARAADAEHHARMRAAAARFGVTRIYPPGVGGISHQVPVDKGLARPGTFVLTSDINSPTLGGINALGIPLGAGLVTALALGRTWLRVPEAIRVELEGRLPVGALARDAAMRVIAAIGPTLANYRVVEFVGDGLSSLDVDQRMTLCNVTVEIGAKSAIAAGDQVAVDHAARRSPDPSEPLLPDLDAVYAATFRLDLGTVEPLVAIPPTPDRTVPVSALEGTRVDQVYIGSCAGGRMEDLRAAAAVLRNRQVAPAVRCLIVPTSADIYREAIAEGLIEVFAAAGASVLPSSCGPCFGYQSPLAAGEVCIATATRNEPGRMGSTDATVYLASAATCALAAVEGVITDPRTPTPTAVVEDATAVHGL